MQYLIINIKALASEYLDYAVLENDAVNARLTRGTWETVLKKSRSRKVIVTIPTEDVFLGDVFIPSRNKKQLKQAIPFALEDALIEAVEQQHFVSHTPASHTENEKQKTWVAVINRRLLQQWINLLRKKKLYGVTLLPDVFLLKYNQKHWTLSKKGKRVLLRTGVFSGFSCSIDILALLLNNQLKDMDAAEKIEQLMSYSDRPLDLDLGDAIKHEVYPSEERVCAKSLLASLALNLNQGVVSQGNLSKQIHWPAWRLAMLSVSLCLIAYLSFIGIQNQQLDKENILLRDQAKQIFLATFKERRSVVNPRVEMQAALKKLRQSSGKVDSMYMEVLHQLGQLLSKDKKIDIKSIRYRERELTVALRGTKVSQLENLKKKMLSMNPMIQVMLRSIASSNSQVTATLVLKEKS